MSQHHTIDVRTMEDVHRLLTTTDFVTADELHARSAGALVAQASASRPEPSPNASAEGLDPLPRRR